MTNDRDTTRAAADRAAAERVAPGTASDGVGPEQASPKQVEGAGREPSELEPEPELAQPAPEAPSAEPAPQAPSPAGAAPAGGEGAPEPPAGEPAPEAPSAAPAPESAAAEAEPVEEAPKPDYKDQWLRAAAELENVRKRARRDVASAEARGIARLARELLPALDSFERALDAAESQPENRDHHLTDGIRLVQSELLAALSRVGIEPDSPKGERFDPHRHEAIAQQPVEGVEPGTIVEVYSNGYRKGDDVLRAAKVVVAA